MAILFSWLLLAPPLPALVPETGSGEEVPMDTGRVRRLVAGCVTIGLTVGLTAVAARAPGHANGPLVDREETWAAHVRGSDAALARRDPEAAEREWHQAYIAAMGSWRWDGPIEVGDAYLRIGEVSGLRPAAAARARNLYLIALFRARQQSSVEGLLRAADGFARVGDRDVAEQCLRLAERLASAHGDPGAAARVRALAARLAGGLPTGDVGP
jgi:hypothetical protein